MSRKLDAAIAEVLGWTSIRKGWDNLTQQVISCAWGKRPGSDRQEHIPRYSTDGNAMLVLISELRERDIVIHDLTTETENDGFKFALKNLKAGKAAYAVARTLPKTVALAAYKALTGEEWRNE